MKNRFFPYYSTPVEQLHLAEIEANLEKTFSNSLPDPSQTVRWTPDSIMRSIHGLWISRLKNAMMDNWVVEPWCVNSFLTSGMWFICLIVSWAILVVFSQGPPTLWSVIKSEQYDCPEFGGPCLHCRLHSLQNPSKKNCFLRPSSQNRMNIFVHLELLKIIWWKMSKIHTES